MGVAIDKTAIVPCICHSISEHDLIAKVKQTAAINQSADREQGSGDVLNCQSEQLCHLVSKACRPPSANFLLHVEGTHVSSVHNHHPNVSYSNYHTFTDGETSYQRGFSCHIHHPTTKEWLLGQEKREKSFTKVVSK